MLQTGHTLDAGRARGMSHNRIGHVILCADGLNGNSHGSTVREIATEGKR